MIVVTVTAQDLAAYVNPDAVRDGEAGEAPDAFVESCVQRAAALVSAYVGAAAVPDVILDEAVLEVGSELYARRKAPGGVAQFGQFESAPVFTARDPLVRTYPLLDQFVPRGLA
ncbi:hypothetical protein HQQ88_08220 [Curtobacterium sp. VKM Ac-2861]|uniref:hypothetical protein n=1 Tax=Curtobacterium sp. VKM Ac-2861 TaxID=2739016 RepID=UPI00156550B0|nr:hypothetical protein [Curtobacterium sp. VKM Ac-2861]